jgi:N-acetylglucosamine-6-sulfatase
MSRLKMINAWIALALLVTLVMPSVTAQSAPGKTTSAPNIVVFMLDDLDQATFDQLLAGGKLPNIEHYLVDHGTTFNEAFVTDSACCPSRASFFTGQYPHNHGVQFVVGRNGGFTAFHTNHPLGLNRPTLAKWLDANGYYTALAGKYLVGYPAPNPLYPIPAGWDMFRAVIDYGIAPGTYHVVREDGTGVQPDLYQTRQIGQWGLEAIASGTRPFFVYLAPTAPHVVGLPDMTHDGCNEVHPQYVARVEPDRPEYNNRGYTPEDYAPYACPTGYPYGCLRTPGGTPLPGWDLPGLAKPSFNSFAGTASFVDKKWDDLSCNSGNLPALQRQQSDRLESMLSVDVMVGKVLGDLEQREELSQTLVIFTGDNGFLLGEHGMGNKVMTYEESIRVPLIIRRPGQVLSNTVALYPALNIDLAPTILDYAGLDWQDSAYAIDGRSLRPLLEAAPGAQVAWREWFGIESWHPRGMGISMNDPAAWWYYPDYAGVRTTTSIAALPSMQDSLYVEYRDPEWPLPGQIYADNSYYNMQSDPYQIDNLYDPAHPSQEQLLLAMVAHTLKACAGAQCRIADDAQNWTHVYLPMMRW